MADNVISIGDHLTGPFHVPTVVMTERCQTASVKLLRGERLICFCRGDKPYVTVHKGPDEICVIGEFFGVWPVAAARVKEQYVADWKRVTVEDVGRMITRIEGALERHLTRKVSP